MVMEDTLLSRAPSSPRLSLSAGRHSSVGISVMQHGGNSGIAAANRLVIPSNTSSGGVNLLHVASSPNLSSPFSGPSLQQLTTIEYTPPRSLSLTNSSSQGVDLNTLRNVHTKESNNPSLIRLRSLPLDDENNRSICNVPTQQRSLPGTPLATPKGGILLSTTVGDEAITLQFQLSIDNARTECKTTMDVDTVASKKATEETNKTKSDQDADGLQDYNMEMKETDREDVESQEQIKTEINKVERFMKDENNPIEIIVKQSSVETTENMDEDVNSLVVDSSSEDNPPPSTRTKSSSPPGVAATDQKSVKTKETTFACDGEEDEDEEENIEREVTTIMECQEASIPMRIARRDYRNSQTPPTYSQRYDDMAGDPSTQTFSSLKEKDASPFASVYSSPSSTSPYTLPPNPARSSSFNTPPLSGIGSQPYFRTGAASPTSPWQLARELARNRHHLPAHHTLPSNYSSLSKKARSQSTVANPYTPYNPYTTTIGSSPSLSNPNAISHHARRDHLALNNLQSDLSKSKRRSVSTCATALSVSPPCKAGRRSSGTFSEEELSSVCSGGTPAGMGVDSNVSSPTLTGILSSSSTSSEKGSVERNSVNEGSPASTVVKFRIGTDSETRARMKSGSHVRFSDDYTGLASLPPSGASSRSRVQSPTGGDSGSNVTTPMSSTVVPGTRCHHLIAEEGDSPFQPTALSSATGTLDHPHGVVRTRSNPEMECCPLCLARKECEILVKRTYSTKVLVMENDLYSADMRRSIYRRVYSNEY